MWIAYRLESKICVLRNGNANCYGEGDGITSAPTTVVQDHEGTVWANTERGVIRFNGKRWEHIGKEWNFPEYVPNENSILLFVDSHGTLWAGVNHTVLYLKQGSKRFESTGTFAGWSVSMAEAPDGTIWLADNSSYVRAISTSVSAQSAATAKCEVEAPKGALPNCPIESPLVFKISGPDRILFDRSGSLWMTSDTSGVFRVPPAELQRNQPISKTNHALQKFNSKDGLSADDCNPILEDREGNIWVATRDGLDQFRDTPFVSISLPTSIFQTAIAPADNGDVWVAGSWAYVARIHADSTNVSLVPADAFKPYRDPAGITWLMGNSLGRWKEGKFQTVATSPDGRLGSFGSWQIAGDSFGTLWAFSNGLGFFSLDHDRWKAWTTPSEVAKQHVANMYSDSTGHIWMSTYEGDIITMDRGTVVDYPRRPDSPLRYVETFAEHAPQEIWAGGDGGLVFIDRGQFHVLRPAALDSLEDVTGIVDAGGAGLWLNTSSGVIHVPRDEADRALRDFSYRFQWERFDSSDGLPGQTVDIFPFPKAAQGTDGKIWFTATRGVAWIDPKNNKISRNALPPPVSITSVSADGSGYLRFAGLHFPAHTANIQIDYSALSLSAPERVRFRYRLDGFDKAWQDVGNRRQAFYTNLGPGPYQFHVIACNNDGVWNEVGASLDFSIAPAYYQTTWFRLLCMAAFASLLWTFYRLRLHQIRQQAMLLQHLPVSAWTLNPDGTPDFVNKVWLEFAGHTLDFVRSYPEAWMASVHPEDREAASRSFWEGVQAGQGFAFETRSVRAQDGTYRWHFQQAVPLRDAEGKLLKFVGTTTDIDDQKRAEESLRQAQGDLERINRVTTMGELAASLAHEISQPISGAVTNANVCLRKLGSDEPDLDGVRSVVLRLVRDTQRAAEILGRIRSQFEKGAPNQESLDVNDLLPDTVALLRDQTTRYNISVRTELTADLPRIVGDRVQLQQVAMNLIVNSIEAMKDVDGTREIVIRSQRLENEQILVSFSDTGIGLPPQLAEQIFNPFFTTKAHGTGMGLRICRSIIEAHRGRLWAAANEGRGATFHFTLSTAIENLR
jgi:PAS domain S-box-containing protein